MHFSPLDLQRYPESVIRYHIFVLSIVPFRVAPYWLLDDNLTNPINKFHSWYPFFENLIMPPAKYEYLHKYVTNTWTVTLIICYLHLRLFPSFHRCLDSINKNEVTSITFNKGNFQITAKGCVLYFLAQICRYIYVHATHTASTFASTHIKMDTYHIMPVSNSRIP